MNISRQDFEDKVKKAYPNMWIVYDNDPISVKLNYRICKSIRQLFTFGKEI